MLNKDQLDTLKELIGMEHIKFHTYSEYVHHDKPEGGWTSEYLPQPATGTESFSYGNLTMISNKKLISDYHPEVIFITSNYWTGSDYSGALVEKCNAETFLEDYGDAEGVYRVYGGYSTLSVAIQLSYLLQDDIDGLTHKDDMLDVLRGLSSYPLIDDEKLSNMESDLEYEYVTSDFKWDFYGEFKSQYNIDIIDDSKEKAWDLYRELSERANEYPTFETNSYPYIDWERIVKAYKVGDLTKFDIMHELIEDD
jgi:hypothetical protein